MKKNNSKVFVAMSGGVDSSVAAALLQKREYDVVGVHMKCWSQSSSDASGIGAPQCGAEQDAEDARRAAEVLGIPFYVFDFEKEYKREVVRYMVDGYKKGITPNPDVMCNSRIKFGLFLRRALELGADCIATGHYVRLMRKSQIQNPKSKTKSKFQIPDKIKLPHAYRQAGITSYQLLTARDKNKDQSYFLWTLTQSQLKYCLFPIGDYPKPQVRTMAKKFHLPNANKKDSQGICFLGQVSLPDFLKKYIPNRKGIVLNTAGEVVGEHRGAHLYTIGQRHIGVANRRLTRTERGLTRTGNTKPLYVAAKDIKKNIITVAEGDDHPALYRSEVILTDANFITPQHTNKLENVGMSVRVRVRYRQPLFKAKLNIECDKRHGARNSNHMSHSTCHMSLTFAEPQKFVAIGQSAVFYVKGNPSSSRYGGTRSGRSSGELRMLGGGIIKSAQ